MNKPIRPAGAAVFTSKPRRPEPRTKTRRQASTAPSSGALLALPLMVAYAGALTWAVRMAKLPWWILVASFAFNLLTFMAYWHDKYAASQNQWRTKEDTLHLFSLLGGWPGGWLAQQVLRHKSSKESFRNTYWVTVVAHCAAVGAWMYWQA